MGLPGSRRPFSALLLSNEWRHLTGQPREREQQIGLQLNLDAEKPRVLQGDAGYSLKNSQGGGSVYYSYTRLEAAGTLVWNGREIPVTGSAWTIRR